MWTKRIMIFLPVAVCLFLAQSYFWVPTYEKQAEFTPERMTHYIAAAGGDAKVLNPTLNADSASSSVCGQVFEGLIDYDEDLNWRGRLATHWEITEEAYFLVRPDDSRLPKRIIELLREEKKRRKDERSPLADTLRNIQAFSIQPAETLKQETSEPIKGKGKAPEFAQVTITVRRPARIKLTLATVDQDLFARLEPLLGEEYFSSFKSADKLLSIEPSTYEKNRSAYTEEFLPPVEHNPIITFHLRKGVLFHDGHEFDSGDVKFTYEAIMDPANISPRTSDYEPVKMVQAVDKYTVKVAYKRLFSPAFSSWGMGVLPEHLLNDERLAEEAKAKGKDPADFSMRESDFNRHPIGCGPYKFVSWKSDQIIELVRFPDYWEGTPIYKRYTYRIIPESFTQELEFYAGAIDGYNVQPFQAKRLRTDKRFQSFSGLSFGYTYIGYNTRRELFKDKRVRTALGMAVDVDEIIKYVLYGEAERTTGPYPKQTKYYDHSVRHLSYDPEAAKRLLAEAGWQPASDGWLHKDGKKFQFTLISSSGNDIRRAIMAIVQDSWKRIGIDCKLELLEWSVFLGKHIDPGDFDACVLGWSMGLDPDLYQLWHSSQSNPFQLNFVGFKNDEADDLIIRIRQEYDEKKQIEMCHKLHRIIADEQPYTFLYAGKWTAVLDKRIFVAVRDPSGKIIGYERIKPTKTGSYGFHFNRWIKLPEMPERTVD